MMSFFTLTFLLIHLVQSKPLPGPDLDKKYMDTVEWNINNGKSNAGKCPLNYIPKFKPPFNEKRVKKWIKVHMECYFAMVNDRKTTPYPDILKAIGTNETVVCWDDDCQSPVSPELSNDINTVAEYIDLHFQVHNISEITDNSFRIHGKRLIFIEKTLMPSFSEIATDFPANKNFWNEFNELYIFNNDGTLKRKEMETSGGLAVKLKMAGFIKYAHFAKRISKNINEDWGFKKKFGYEFDAFVVIALSVIGLILFIVFILMIKIFRKLMPNFNYQKVDTYEK